MQNLDDVGGIAPNSSKSVSKFTACGHDSSDLLRRRTVETMLVGQLQLQPGVSRGPTPLQLQPGVSSGPTRPERRRNGAESAELE